MFSYNFTGIFCVKLPPLYLLIKFIQAGTCASSCDPQQASWEIGSLVNNVTSAADGRIL